MPEIPEIPTYVYWVICGIALLIGARFRLTALLQAGKAPAGPGRTLRTLRLLALDAISFAATAYLLRLGPFPLLMSAIFSFGLTIGLLEVQWYFKRPDRAAAAATPASVLREGMQGLQNAAWSAGYGRAETWVQEEYRKSKWRLSLGYQGIMVLLCAGLRVLDTLQGGWLYMLFSLVWQSGVTGFLYWRFDLRRKAKPQGPMPTGPMPGSPGQAPPSPGSRLPGASHGPGGRTPPGRMPFSIPRPGAPRQSAPPGAMPPSPSSQTSQAGARPSRRPRFALRSDVQAMVALSAGIWCGIFALFLGWWYGFASVTAFRTLISLGSPIASGLIGRVMPASLQGYVRPANRPTLWTLSYFKSREFWYGPGMGLLGGIAGAVLRYLLFSR